MHILLLREAQLKEPYICKGQYIWTATHFQIHVQIIFLYFYIESAVESLGLGLIIQIRVESASGPIIVESCPSHFGFWPQSEGIG